MTIKIQNTQNATSGRVLFALDVSRSMLARENEVYTRLETAKALIEYAIDKYPSHQYGLYVFAEEGMQIIPFTQDIDVFLTLLKSVDETSIYQQGSNFLGAFEDSLSRFQPQQLTHDIPDGGLVVMISDFEPTDHMGNYSTEQKKELFSRLKELTSLLKEYSVHISLIGLGGTEGTPIILGENIFGDLTFQKDRNGKRVLTKFEADTFQEIQKIFSASGMHIQSEKDAAAFQFPPIPTSTLQNKTTLADQSARIFGMLAFVCLLLWGGLFYYFDGKGK